MKKLILIFAALALSLSMRAASTSTAISMPDSRIIRYDTTVNNADTAGHGFLPKLTGAPGAYYSAYGAWVTNAPNLIECGASPLGVIDAAAAFAIAEGNGKTNVAIDVPEGVFVVNNYSLTNLNIWIRGRGKGTVFIPPPGITNQNIFRSTVAGQNIFISDCVFDMKQIPKSALNFVGVGSVNLERVKVTGVGTPSPSNVRAIDGVSISAPYCKVTARECEFSFNERDGLFCWPPQELHVENCYFEGNGRNACSADLGTGGAYAGSYAAQKVTYLGNTATNCYGGGFYCESKTNIYCQLTAIGNKIRNCGQQDGGWGYSYAVVAGNHTYGVIEGNFIENFGVGSSSVGYGNGIDAGNSFADVRIAFNTIINARGVGINFNKTYGWGKPIIIGNNVTNSGLQGVYIYNAPEAIVSGNRVEASQREGVILNLSNGSKLDGNFIVNNSLAGSASYSAVNLISTLSPNLIGNTINGANHAYGVLYDASSRPRNMVGNRITTFVTGWISGSGGSTAGSIFDGQAVFIATALPASGTWVLRDKFLNASPTAGGFEGWICTTAGTSGTWKTTGAITP